MADALVKHAFVSTIPEGTDPTKIRTSSWNAPELFTGGSAGEFLVRDTGSATGAAWSPATTALSTWTGSANLTTAGPFTLGTVVGIVGGTGTGLVAFGTAGTLHPGYGLYMDVGNANVLGTAGNEIIGAHFAAGNSPTAPTTNNTGAFGLTSLGTWTGSANSISDGLVYGGQFTGQLTGTASLKIAYGIEGTVRGGHTAGTIATAIGVWAHNDNQSTGLITTSIGLLAQAGGSGVTTGIGVRVSTVTGGTVYGLKVEDLTAGTVDNYAIYTGAGKVHFGGAVDVVQATLTTVLGGSAGIVAIGTGAANAGLQILAPTGQASNLIDAKVNGVTKFSIGTAGAMTFTGDLNFGSNTAIFGATASMRIVTSTIAHASAGKMTWSPDTSPYTAPDTGFSRNAAGVLEINNGTQVMFAGAYRDLATRNNLAVGYYEGTEMTAPAAGAVNTGRLFFQDNGSGKTQLMVIFNTGGALQIAIEP